MSAKSSKLITSFPLARSSLPIDRGEYYFSRSNFCKDRREKIEVPDPFVVEDLIRALHRGKALISDKLNNRRKLARLIKQYGDISIGIYYISKN